MPSRERIISSGDFCTSDTALKSACDRSLSLDIDVQIARQQVAGGMDPDEALRSVLEAGSIGARAEANLAACLSTIALGACAFGK